MDEQKQINTRKLLNHRLSQFTLFIRLKSYNYVLINGCLYEMKVGMNLLKLQPTQFPAQRCGRRNMIYQSIICSAQTKTKSSLSMPPKQKKSVGKGIPKPKPQTEEYKQKMSLLFKERWQNNPKLFNQERKRKNRRKKALKELKMPFDVAEARLEMLQYKIDIWLEAYRDIFGKEPNPREVRDTNPSMYYMILECGDLEEKVSKVRRNLDSDKT